MAPTICARCSKVVYFNEEKKAIGKSYHNSCFVCGEFLVKFCSLNYQLICYLFLANSTCKRRLDPGSLTEHDDDIFCRPCYSRLFGPKGYGYGNGQNTLSMFTGDDSEPTTRNIPATAQAY